MPKKFTTEEFILRAKEIHGKKYDYSQTKYIDTTKKVKIICPIHGEFLQTPSNHLSGYDCKLCGIEKRKHSQSKSTKEFIKQSKKIHGNKYDYKSVNYVNRSTPVKIYCNKHKIYFYQKPSNHLAGCGCQKCGIENATLKSIKKSHKSLPEQKLYKLLVKKYGKDDVLVNHKDDILYPWKVDFYVKSRNLFIEYNGFYTHHDCWYNGKSKTHRDLKYMLENSDKYGYNKKYKTWIVSDVEKRKTAKRNNLNYVVLWNEQDIEDWFTLGCPNGHDGDGMYTWKGKTYYER